MAIDFSDTETQAALKSAGYLSQDEAQALAQKSNSALEANKNSILEQLKIEKEKTQGVDIDAYKKLSEDPRFKTVLSGGFDTYESNLGGELQGRLSALQSDLMIKEQGYLQGTQELEQTVEQLNKKLSNSELKRKLGMALVKDEMVDPLAMTEIERDALDELALDDKGNIVVIGEDGLVRQTADGPMRESHWLTEMKKNKPYRFKGADGGHKRTANGSINTEGMSPSEKMAASRRQL